MTEKNIYETQHAKEKVVLAGIDTENTLMKVEESLLELSELAKTADAVVVGQITQKREAAHSAHYLGKGKLDELKDLVNLTEADTVICDDELTASQMRVLAEEINAKVIDRTMLILDIFGGRANSAEGKLQVELAQLKYNLSHLTGLGKSMSRLGGGAGGGIGARRGSGEKKLELDRRYLRDRISELNKEIKEIQKQRSISRDKRERRNIPVVSMVGYTNAGKSTIMNLLTNAGVLAEDKLFATLDTTTRRINLPGGTDVLFTDTVGFIQKLPHTLVDAFKATLEELNYADILIHVVDTSSDMRTQHMEIVYKTLSDLKCTNKPVITVFNKSDKEIVQPLPNDVRAFATVSMSAKTGTGKNELLTAIEETINSFRKKITVLIPYSETKLVNLIHGSCEIVQEDYKDVGILLELYTNKEMQNRLDNFILT